MQEIKMPDGRMIREFFTETEVKQGKARARRQELEKLGGELRRFVWVDSSKYLPHQGSQECVRRRRQMERIAAKV
jgi:hypothetical protein